MHSLLLRRAVAFRAPRRAVAAAAAVVVEAEAEVAVAEAAVADNRHVVEITEESFAYLRDA